MKRRSRGRKMKVSRPVMAIGIIVLLLGATLLLLPRGGTQEGEQASTDIQGCRDDFGQVIDSFNGLFTGNTDGFVNCTLDVLGLAPGEGDERVFYFSYDGDEWVQLGEGFHIDALSTGESYQSETFVPGSEDVEIVVLNEDKIVYNADSSRDAGNGFIEVQILDLPGTDTVELHDADGTIYVFEVA